jgi:ABC-type xylose transport system permease subunit
MTKGLFNACVQLLLLLDVAMTAIVLEPEQNPHQPNNTQKQHGIKAGPKPHEAVKKNTTQKTTAHHFLVLRLCQGVPALIIVDVTVVAVVLFVTQSPAVVGHEDEGVQQVAHSIVELQQGLYKGLAAAAAAAGFSI